LEAVRERTTQRRDQESSEEHQQRLEAVRERTTQRRNQESLEEHQQRLERDRVSHVQQREQESSEEHQQRLEHDRAGHVQRRDLERLAQQQMFAVEGLDMTPETLEEKLAQGGEDPQQLCWGCAPQGSGILFTKIYINFKM
jgi:hypothetical protein